jgi:hypothetical protein
MLELTVNLSDGGDDYMLRVACPCGHLQCPDEPLQIDVTAPLTEVGREVNERLAAQLEMLRREHPDGVVCADCGETSTIGPPLAWWTHPALLEEQPA